MVGINHQAHLPEAIQQYEAALPYDNEDTMMWNPRGLSPREIEEYLIRVEEVRAGISLPRGNHTRDSEAALYLLLQCGYDTEEALRRLKLNTSDPATDLPWSEEECSNFEEGLKIYGKKFRLIHLNKLRSRKITEIIGFYYLWKKTERYDTFAYKSRIDKKRYYLRPGVTDYMEKFLENDDHRPLQSIVYGDPDWKPDEKTLNETKEPNAPTDVEQSK